MLSAIIDIGSNSIRLFVFDNDKVVYKDLLTTRLSTGLIKYNKMLEEDIAKSIEAVSNFVNKAKEFTQNVYIFGTATCRQAINSKEFVERITKETNIQVHVLSGEEEGKIGFIGGSILAREFPACVVDIGGASTEIAIGTKKEILNSTSYPIGAVKAFVYGEFDKDKIESYINDVLSSIKPNHAKEYFAIGGGATALASILSGSKTYDDKVTNGFVIRKEELKSLTNKLFKMTKEERESLTMISEKRREIIHCNGLVLLKVMDFLQIDEIVASETDNTYGYKKVYIDYEI